MKSLQRGHLHSDEARLQKVGSSFRHTDQVLKGSKMTRTGTVVVLIYPKIWSGYV
jgi:hypothetical protein